MVCEGSVCASRSHACGHVCTGIDCMYEHVCARLYVHVGVHVLVCTGSVCASVLLCVQSLTCRCAHVYWCAQALHMHP